MAHYANKVLCADDSIFDSLVITHGTGKCSGGVVSDLRLRADVEVLLLSVDTLEETAFFSQYPV